MMELADVLDSKSSGSDTVSVRPRLPAPIEKDAFGRPFLLVPVVPSRTKRIRRMLKRGEAALLARSVSQSATLLVKVPQGTFFDPDYAPCAAGRSEICPSGK